MYPPATVSTDSDRALAELRQAAAQRGLLELAEEFYALRVACGTLLLGALALFAWTTPSLALAAGLAALAGLVSVQVGFAAHDAGHGAVSARPWVNECVGQLAFSVVNGLGFGSWRVSHDAHHAHSQDESLDPDMQVDVVLSLTPASARAKTGLGLRLLPYQGWYLWPLAMLFAHSLRIQSLCRSYREPRRFALDALLLPLHYALWFAVPIVWLGTPPLRALGVYLCMSASVGVYLALLFWVNHVGMPALRAGHGRSPLEQQVLGTRNIRHPAWLDGLFGGLDFQIEHHLLPGCPSGRLRRVQPLARETCARAGLPYHEEALTGALASVTRHVSAVARTRTG